MGIVLKIQPQYHSRHHLSINPVLPPIVRCHFHLTLIFFYFP